jgi:hypothetical protein
MEEELGCPIAEVFSSISERPIAAASLGQARPPAPLCHVQWSREAVLERTGSRVHCLVLCCAFALSRVLQQPGGWAFAGGLRAAGMQRLQYQTMAHCRCKEISCNPCASSSYEGC